LYSFFKTSLTVSTVVVTIDCGNFSRKDVILGQGDPTQRPKDGDVQDDYKRTTQLSCIYENDDQGRSQGSTGVTVVRGPQAQGGPEGSPGGPRKGPRKKAARERAVKAKIGAVCLLEKGRK
jgi:hypothetical protein